MLSYRFALTLLCAARPKYVAMSYASAPAIRIREKPPVGHNKTHAREVHGSSNTTSTGTIHMSLNADAVSVGAASQ